MIRSLIAALLLAATLGGAAQADPCHPGRAPSSSAPCLEPMK